MVKKSTNIKATSPSIFVLKKHKQSGWDDHLNNYKQLKNKVMACGTISKNIAGAICAGNTIPGINKRIILINFEDYQRATITKGISPNVIASIALAASAKGYAITTLDKANISTISLKLGTYSNQFQHKVTTNIFVKSQDVKDQICDMINGKFVAIVENNSMGVKGETKYELLGADSGLLIIEFESVSNNADGVVYSFALGQSETMFENSLPMSVFKTDYATTQTMVNGLVAAS